MTSYIQFTITQNTRTNQWRSDTDVRANSLVSGGDWGMFLQSFLVGDMDDFIVIPKW